MIETAQSSPYPSAGTEPDHGTSEGDEIGAELISEQEKKMKKKEVAADEHWALLSV